MTFVEFMFLFGFPLGAAAAAMIAWKFQVAAWKRQENQETQVAREHRAQSPR